MIQSSDWYSVINLDLKFWLVFLLLSAFDIVTEIAIRKSNWSFWHQNFQLEVPMDITVRISNSGGLEFLIYLKNFDKEFYWRNQLLEGGWKKRQKLKCILENCYYWYWKYMGTLRIFSDCVCFMLFLLAPLHIGRPWPLEWIEDLSGWGIWCSTDLQSADDELPLSFCQAGNSNYIYNM